MPLFALHRRRIALLLPALACAALVRAAPADGAVATVPPPQGKVLLSVAGAIELRNAGDRMDFDDAMLASLAQHRYTTRTPWDKQAREFSGPLLRDVLKLVRAHGSELAATALNDYHATIPVSDAYLHDMLIVRLVDGQPLRVRDRGPLLIVYPFDRDQRLSGRAYVARSVWQLQRLEVR